MLPVSDIPNPAIAGFNWQSARACLQWCGDIYPRDDGTENTPPYNGVVVKSTATNAIAWVAETPESIVVVFRGSKDPADYIQDSKFDLARYVFCHTTCRVHLGFMEDWQSIRSGVAAAVLKLPHKPVFVAGHSLGGGQAILCAADLKNHGFRIAGVYTFGQPRVGDSTFKSAYNAVLGGITWRVVNQNDIVPRVPGLPTTWFVPSTWPYRHCGHEVFLPVGGGYIMDASVWQSGQSNVAGLWRAFKNQKDVLVNNHHFNSYQQRTENLT